MGETAQQALKAESGKKSDFVCVGSSVGAGVLLQGLAQHLKEGGKLPLAIILIGPVFDPISAVEQLAGKQICEALEAGKMPAIPVQVSAAEGQADPGVFYMSLAHMKDPAAERVFKTGPASTAVKFIRQHNIPIVVFTAENDKYSPPIATQSFMQLLSRPITAENVHIWQGVHNGQAEQRFEHVREALKLYVPETQRPARTPLAKGIKP